MNLDASAPWVPDELGYAGPEHLDPDFIAGFDRKQGYPDPEPDIAAFAAHGLDGSSTVLDFGAGTGQFAIPAASRFGRVIAVDVSAAMVSALRAKAVQAKAGQAKAGQAKAGQAKAGQAKAGQAKAGRADGAGPVVDCVRGGFLSYSPDGPVDGIYTRNALHQLPDFWKAIALRRLADMLRPGGVLRLRDLVYDFTPEQAPGIFADWFDGAAADPAAGYTAADYAEHIRTEYSTFRWLLEPMLAAAGFQIAGVDYERRLYCAYTCVKS